MENNDPVAETPAQPTSAEPYSVGTPVDPVWPPAPLGSETAGTAALTTRYLSLRPLEIGIYVALLLYTLLDVTSLGLHMSIAYYHTVALILDAISALPMFAAFITLMFWTHRAYGNLTAFGATGLSVTPGMAVGYHFIPLLAVFKPFLVYNEMARASDPRVSGVDRKSRRRARTVPTIYLWWLLYIVGAIISALTFQSSSQGQQTQGVLPIATTISFVENLALAHVVFVITRRQEEKERQLSQVSAL